MYTEETVIGDNKYQLASMRTGQLRDLYNLRQAKPDRNFMEDNIFTVAACLMNGAQEAGQAVADLAYYTTLAENLPCAAFSKILEVSNRISGFVEKKLGESPATE